MMIFAFSNSESADDDDVIVAEQEHVDGVAVGDAGADVAQGGGRAAQRRTRRCQVSVQAPARSSQRPGEGSSRSLTLAPSAISVR